MSNQFSKVVDLSQERAIRDTTESFLAHTKALQSGASSFTPQDSNAVSDALEAIRRRESLNRTLDITL